MFYIVHMMSQIRWVWCLIQGLWCHDKDYDEEEIYEVIDEATDDDFVKTYDHFHAICCCEDEDDTYPIVDVNDCDYIKDQSKFKIVCECCNQELFVPVYDVVENCFISCSNCEVDIKLNECLTEELYEELSAEVL